MKAWELIKALEEGEKLQHKNPAWFRPYVDENNINKDNLMNIYLYPNNWEIYTEPSWEDNIPECGVPCWVDNNIVMIIRYQDGPWPYVSSCGIEYSGIDRRLTKSEIQQWIDNAPEE